MRCRIAQRGEVIAMPLLPTAADPKKPLLDPATKHLLALLAIHHGSVRAALAFAIGGEVERGGLATLASREMAAPSAPAGRREAADGRSALRDLPDSPAGAGRADRSREGGVRPSPVSGDQS